MAAMKKKNLKSEKRVFPRRRVKPKPVMVTYLAVLSAQLLDYSPTGMNLLVDHKVAVETVLQVRPANAAADFAGVEVQVKNCRSAKGKWELGCQFVHTQHWDDLAVFG